MSAFICAGAGSGTVSQKYAFHNDYTRSMKVNMAVALLVQETFQLCSAMHTSVTLLCSCKPALPLGF